MIVCRILNVFFFPFFKIGISVECLDKVVFLGNRSFLPKDHALRKQITGFPYKRNDNPPPELTANDDILWSSVAYDRAKNKTQAANVAKATGCKGVNCFMLLPNHDRTKQIFPDLMHDLKNIVVTFFDLITGRGDTVKVRNAEKEFGKFKDCWVNSRGNYQ